MRIVFDAGGVLFDDGIKKLLASISDDPDLENWYRANIHNALMRGETSETGFWKTIIERTDSLESPDELRARFLDDILVALPAVKEIQRWSREAELWILSNHRHEWLEHCLEREGIRDCFSNALISSQIKARKPEQAAFDLLASEQSTVYIDDKQANLDMASNMGFDTILADANNLWMQKLDRWILAQTNHRISP